MTGRPPRADAARNRDAALAAADALFDGARPDSSVSMDAIARSAGVGKATVFRAFGDRVGLLRAVMARRNARLTAAIDAAEPPFTRQAPTAERIAVLLGALLDFKLENRQLSLALDSVGRNSPYQAENYTWWHDLLTGILVDRLDAPHAAFTAHALLAATRADLIEYLLSVEEASETQVRESLMAHVRRVVG